MVSTQPSNLSIAWRLLLHLATITLICVPQCVVVLGAREPPMVQVPDQGMLMGVHLKMFRTQVIAAFLGIPFAQPPVGQRRFQPPVNDPLPRWDGIRNATQLPAECLQNPLQPMRKHEEAFASLISSSYGQTTMGSATEEPAVARHFNEDCLFLNIYMPDGTSWYFVYSGNGIIRISRGCDPENEQFLLFNQS